jgi:hypothetical protein
MVSLRSVVVMPSSLIGSNELTAECPKKIARNMNDWLRFGESQDDWVELFGLNLY